MASQAFNKTLFVPKDEFVDGRSNFDAVPHNLYCPTASGEYTLWNAKARKVIFTITKDGL